MSTIEQRRKALLDHLRSMDRRYRRVVWIQGLAKTIGFALIAILALCVAELLRPI